MKQYPFKQRSKKAIYLAAWIFYTILFIGFVIVTVDGIVGIKKLQPKTPILHFRADLDLTMCMLILSILSAVLSIYCWKRLLELWWPTE